MAAKHVFLAVVCLVAFTYVLLHFNSKSRDKGVHHSKDHSKTKRLLAFDETQRAWMSEEEMLELAVKKVNFMDVTDFPSLDASEGIPTPDPLPTQPKHKTYLEKIVFPHVSGSSLKSDLNHLTNFTTRYYKSATGVQAAHWIASQFKNISSERKDIRVELFENSGYDQPSVIATIPGIGPDKDQVVVIGAHEDSIGSTATGRAPGADDDGSGTVTVIEVFRALVAVNHYPDRTLKFMTYAAEEVGLLGSQAIANSYKANNSNVYGVLQLDMTGYGGMGPVGVVGDNVDLGLTSFLKLLIDTYSLLEWTDTKCGYGCSDHASWTRAGYRAIFPFETPFSQSNPYIHSASDLISHLSLDRMVEFTKIGVAFAVEMGGTTIQP